MYPVIGGRSELSAITNDQTDVVIQCGWRDIDRECLNGAAPLCHHLCAEASGSGGGAR